MWWRRRRASRPAAVDTAAAIDPVVLAVTTPLTGSVAISLATQVDRLSSDAPVVIDVTGIPSFDSEGASALAGLQERFGTEVVTIVGFRQAAARLTGAMEVAEKPKAQQGWVVRRLHKLAVIQADEAGSARADDLEGPLAAAGTEEVAIVVVDLRGVPLTAQGTEALAFASSAAAVRGQELLVVNVDASEAEQLRQAGLSATTYVAPGS